MKSIFSKLLNAEQEQKAVSTGTPLMNVPPPVSMIECPFEVQRRSLIGMIARKMAKQLKTEKKVQDNLIYLPFLFEAFAENRNNEPEYLLFLAERMVEWIKDQEDVYLKIRESILLDKYHGCFLNVFEEVKGDIASIFHPSSDDAGKECSPGEENIEWRIYRDVMYAVTQRKFLLISKHEIEKYKQGQQLCEVPIKERADIPKARDIAKDALVQSGYSQGQIMSFLLIISEAITNILKHANYGKMTVVRNDHQLNVLVEDEGPGFDLKLLPNAALMSGYSTKKSLGQGFTLMMKMADEVLLSTSSSGSTIVLVFIEKVGAKREGVV